MKLSILIPTTPDRAECFGKLMTEMTRQSNGLPVEIIYDDEGKHLSIGLKRDRMYRKASGIFSVQWDSDDWIKEDGIPLIINAIESNPNVDTITYFEKVDINGEQNNSCFSLQYEDWHENPVWPEGFKYARTPFFKTPIRTNICKEVGVIDCRYGEDHDFSKRIKPLLFTSVHIQEFIYYYQYASTDFNERYGIQ